METFKKILITLVCLLSLLLTGLLTGTLLFSTGQPSQNARASAADTGVVAGYQLASQDALSNALDGVLAIEKKYWIQEDALAAPVPKEENYGTAESPQELAWLIADAADFLDGENLYFSVDTQIMPGSVIQYYRDDTILAITWKSVIDYMVYTFSEVKVAHPSQFRRFVADGEYGSEKLYITQEMAKSVNAVVASSGDYYLHRNVGVVVYDGVVRKAAGKHCDTCFVDSQGNLSFARKGEILTMEDAQAYVAEHDSRFSLAFGPVLVEDGQVCTPSQYSLGEIDDHYARAALCQLGKLHYLVATVNSEGTWRNVPTIHQFAKRIQETGCDKAYALDGGQTAAIVMKNQLINNVVYGYQRKISDIIYFATAIPDGGV